MKGIFVVLLIFVPISPSLCARVRPKESSSFNVVSYGAKGDGQTDDSGAFMQAWEDVCGATQDIATLVIEESKTFLLQPVLFDGPCKPTTINIKLQGTIIAPENPKAWRWAKGDGTTWVEFSNIRGLVINGGGQLDAQGAAWWKSININSRPTALKFRNCENLSLSGLTHTNSPRNHIGITICNGLQISNLLIIAPEDSPNTDGIDISGSSNILIQKSTIQTGDDCIAIKTGSSFINITGVLCGPGHGISVGSLGRNGDYAKVEEVHVQNCTFKGTTNGVRIKTWMGGAGYARKITFADIFVVGAKNPVIIDQQYSDVAGKTGGKAVKISDVTYHNVKGTCRDEKAIILNCDSNVGCTNLMLEDISITTEDGSETEGLCKNAEGTCHSCHPTVPCLSTK